MTAASARARKSLPPEVTDEVRRAVRGLLETAPAFRTTSEGQQRELAQGLVDLGLVAAGLMDEERKSGDRLKRKAVATGMSAGDQLSMQATRAAAGTLTGLRDAIDFPNYVGSLITGVFQAILNSASSSRRFKLQAVVSLANFDERSVSVPVVSRAFCKPTGRLDLPTPSLPGTPRFDSCARKPQNQAGLDCRA